MTSSVTQYSNLININYPIPGVNNDTQGFRSNFSTIQSALTRAGAEISDLQKNAVSLSSTNDFGNNIIKRAALQNSSQVVNNVGVVSSTVNIDFTLGSYQQIKVESGTYNIIVNNWPPSGQVGTLRLEITPLSSDPISINFVGTSYILTRTPLPITYAQASPIVWELWSPDAGSSIYAHELGTVNSIVTASNIVAYNSISVNDNKFTVKAITSATIVENKNYAQELALVPHIVSATIEQYGCDHNNTTEYTSTTTHFMVTSSSDVKNIRDGSILWFNDIKYTVTATIGNTIYVDPWFDVQSIYPNHPIGSVIEFVNLRYNQPSTLHLVSREPVITTGQSYDLKGQAYVDKQKFWVAYKDHDSGTDQWLKVATQPGRNVFTQVNTFTHITNFKAPIILANYTQQQADALIPVASTGTLIFITSDVNKPAYFYDNKWNLLCCNAGVSAGLEVIPSNATWDVVIGGSGQSLGFSLPLGINFNNNSSSWST